MSKVGGTVITSRTSYGDPVAHYIRGVYDEYMSKWSNARQGDTEKRDLARLAETKALSLPAAMELQLPKSTGRSAPTNNIVDVVRNHVQQRVEVSAAVVDEALQRQTHASTSTSGQGHPTNAVNQNVVPTDQANERHGAEIADRGMFGDDLEAARSIESPLSSIDESRFSSSRLDHRCDTCWRDSIPCQHSPDTTMTRTEYLRKQHSSPQKHKRTRSQPKVIMSKNTSLQELEQQQQNRRNQGREQNERETQEADDGSTKRKGRITKRQPARVEAASQLSVIESGSDEDIVQFSPRPRTLTSESTNTKPAKHFRMGSEEIAALTSTPTLTPANLRRNTAVPRQPVADPEAEEQARLKRKEEREATERAIAEQQAAEMRAKEASIRKCYYCWHYSQPCNLKLKPKCIPCHKNRRSCFGGYTRLEFCDAYKERTGKVHKQAEKDIIKPRQSMKRKGHCNGNRTVAKTPQPQRFFLNDNKLKCYRCWDRNLSCDLDTPKCASCVKGRAACFGFKSSRQEFCEMFEEETGEKHRWAAFFESGGIQTTPPPSATTPTKRRSRKTAREDETSESENAWNSQSDENDDDHDQDTNNDSDDD